MANKRKPKITVTKENYNKLKDESKSYHILKDLLDVSDTHASTEIMRLQRSERDLKNDEAHYKACLDGILTMCGHREDYMSIENVLHKIEEIRKAVVEAAGVSQCVIQEHDMACTGDLVGSVRGALRILYQDKDELERKLKHMKHRNERLKEALRSSLHTNKAVADVIGQFEEEEE